MHAEHQSARQRWRDEEGDGSTLTGEEDGVSIVMKYEGSNRCTDYRSVFLDGHLFAREWETVPWNIFKPIAVGYTVFLDLSKSSASEMIRLINPKGNVVLEPEWYPPEDRSPQYFAHCTDFADVIALWKIWRTKYL